MQKKVIWYLNHVLQIQDAKDIFNITRHHFSYTIAASRKMFYLCARYETHENLIYEKFYLLIYLIIIYHCKYKIPDSSADKPTRR